MREIKFRAWDNQGKHWYPAETMKDFFNYLSEKFAIIADWFNEDAISLEQYTGSKDKNGKEIYEGDIVSFENEKGFARVLWRDGKAMFGLEWLDCGVEDELSYWIDCKGPVEVIGNIHENPELLKEEK